MNIGAIQANSRKMVYVSLTNVSMLAFADVTKADQTLSGNECDQHDKETEANTGVFIAVLLFLIVPILIVYDSWGNSVVNKMLVSRLRAN